MRHLPANTGHTDVAMSRYRTQRLRLDPAAAGGPGAGGGGLPPDRDKVTTDGGGGAQDDGDRVLCRVALCSVPSRHKQPDREEEAET